MSKGTLDCRQCSGTMKQDTKTNSNLLLQLVALVIFLFGLSSLLFGFGAMAGGADGPGLASMIFGAVLCVGSYKLGYKRTKIWKCQDCGHFFERA